MHATSVQLQYNFRSSTGEGEKTKVDVGEDAWQWSAYMSLVDKAICTLTWKTAAVYGMTCWVLPVPPQSATPKQLWLPCLHMGGTLSGDCRGHMGPHSASALRSLYACTAAGSGLARLGRQA